MPHGYIATSECKVMNCQNAARGNQVQFLMYLSFPFLVAPFAPDNNKIRMNQTKCNFQNAYQGNRVQLGYLPIV